MERTSLVDAGESAETSSGRRRMTWRGAAAASATLLVGAAAVFRQAGSSAGAAEPAELASAAQQQQRASAPTARALKLRASSGYERQLGVAIGDGRYPFPNLVEIHQPTRLELATDADEFELVRAEHATWRIEAAETAGATEEGGVTHTGNPVDFTFTKLGRTFVHGASVDPATPGTASFEVTVKYVRRELRDLNDADRRAYFDALNVIYTVGQEDGEAKYGSDYRSSGWLVREHLYGAGSKECDHWHDDAGFVNHHVGITLQMEKSMRAIDPRTCAHYWDYTLDAVAESDYSDSVVFDDDWFGPANPKDAKHVVDTGRWAYTPVMQHARHFSNVTNPYGLLRSPWNTNPVPYLMRSRNTVGVQDAKYTMPRCDSFQDAFTSGASLADVIQDLNGELHGMIHIMLGGHWFMNQSFIEKIVANKWAMDTSPHIADQMLLGSKFLWRQGFVRCPEVCDIDAPESECVCSCPSEIKGDRTSHDVMEDAGLFSILPTFESVMVDEMGISHDELLDALCHVGHPGEMFTSAAPQDPIFWPLHGLSERFLQLLRLYKSEGKVELDETWGYTHMHMVLSDTHTVCDWEGVTGMGMPTCKQNSTCSGHRVDDVLPFKDVLPGKEYWTNRQFYKAIAPWSEELPYVFDRLTSWPGCPNGTLI